MTSTLNSFFARSAVRRTIAAVSWIGLAIYLYSLTPGLFQSPEHQRDFRTYYESAKLFHAGGDPYDYSALVRSAHDTLLWRYVYPPVTLPIFESLLVLPIGTARTVYFALQVFGIIVLLAVWRKYFVEQAYAVPLLILFVMFGFNSSASVDLDVGNVVILTQCLLWIAFAAFLRKRYTVFATLIFLAALFKGIDILFLALLLLEHDKRAMRWLIGTFALFADIHIISFTLYPSIYREWLFNIYHLGDRGKENPAMLPAIEDLLNALCIWLRIGRWWHTGHIIFLCYAAVFATFAARFAVRRKLIHDRITLVMFAVMTYALLLPRFKNYSYVMLLLPAAWLILTRIPNRWFRLLLILAVCIPIFDYQPLVVSICMYIALVWSIGRDALYHQTSRTGELGPLHRT